MTLDSRTEIAYLGLIIEQRVRDYCRNQVATWHQVPSLALQAGVHHQSYELTLASEQNLWRLLQGNTYDNSPYVDLNNGELVCTDRTLVCQDDVLILVSRLNLINATRVCNDLKKIIRRATRNTI